jgi:hypothetical protein
VAQKPGRQAVKKHHKEHEEHKEHEGRKGKSLMGASEWQAYITTLREFSARLEARLTPLSDAQLDQRTAETEWSTRQIVHHLADSHMSANFRFRLPVSETGATLPTYDQDAWARMIDYALPLEPSLQMLRGWHTRIVALLESLGEDEWQRTATHPAWGEVTVEEVARRYAAHCDNHMAQIDGIGAIYGW